jgi:hypothetical protein
MQKIFDSSKSADILYTEVIKKTNKCQKTSSASNLNKFKWQTVEPVRLIKSNMILPLKSSNLSLNNKLENNNSNIICNKSININSNIISFRKNSNTSLVKRFITFDDVKIIMNDDQLKEFKEIIDKAFTKNKKKVDLKDLTKKFQN